MLNTVHLQTVRLQTAPLRERLLAQVALVRPDARVGARVSLQVERVVEALSAERAQVPFDVRVALHVPIQQTLQVERLCADAAHELVRVVIGQRNFRGGRRLRFLIVPADSMVDRVLDRQGILNSVAAVHKL